MIYRIELIDKFGPEIEFDLLPLNVRIHDFFTGARPWGQLERILARLPRHSHYKAAIDNDDQYAEIAETMQRADQKVRIPLAGYDDVVFRLDNLFDAVMSVGDILRQVYSKHGRAPQPVRAYRPETAQQRLKRHKAHRKLQSIEERMSGGR